MSEETGNWTAADAAQTAARVLEASKMVITSSIAMVTGKPQVPSEPTAGPVRRADAVEELIKAATWAVGEWSGLFYATEPRHEAMAALEEALHGIDEALAEGKSDEATERRSDEGGAMR